MTPRSDALRAMLREQRTEAARIHVGIHELERLYGELIRSSVPPNPQFEIERIITSLPNRREILFMLGLLSEGENEAALLLALIDRMLAADATAATAHVLDEASYYLRTSIEETWQPEERPVSAQAALVYLFTILDQRLERLHLLPARATPDVLPGKKVLLETLRAELDS